MMKRLDARCTRAGTGVLAAILAGVLTACDLACTCRAADTAPPLLDDVVVTGERTGPGMWHVHAAAANLYVLGSIAPLPRDITWRSKQAEQVLDGAQRVYVQKPFEIGVVRILWILITERKVLMVTGGKRLKDVMPPDLYVRFSALRTKYNDDPKEWEHYRPLIASAFLQRAAFHSVGLSARVDLGASVRTLAKQRNVPVEEVKIAGVGDVLDALKTMPAATERTCVEASLVTMESGLPRLIDRARAWATGNLERIESLHQPPEVDACVAALDSGAASGDLVSRMRRTWLDTLDKSLHAGGVTLAVVNMDLLLGRGGLLEELRAKGYQVDPP